MLKVHIAPSDKQIRDDNGVGQVVHAMYRYLPDLGIELVGDPDSADVIAAHFERGNLPRVDVLHSHGLYWSDVPHASFSAWHHDANARIIATARTARAITVPSEWVAMPFKRDMRLSPHVIGHGVDLAAWEPAESQGFILWNKNRNGDVCDPTPAWELAMRGERVKSTFAPNGKTAPATMQVLGVLPHATMRDLIRHAGVYLATTHETFGIGTVEALAAGVPVLGYTWGGTVDIVEHGVSGWLVEPGDIDGLVEGLAYIRKRGAAMRRAARKRAERYGWQQIVGEYADLYRSVAEGCEAETDKVAIVITNYNYSRFVGGAIESALIQGADEIIVVDDGSTDNSLDVIDRYDVRTIWQTNQGVAAARNIGIAATDAPYIVCLDADDRLAPGFVETLREAMVADRSLGIAYTGLGLIQPNGSISPNPRWPIPFDWEIQTRPTNPPATCIPSGCMFRRAMWERAGGYQQRWAPGEDAEFWTRGLSLGFTARKVTERYLFHYRLHGEGAHSRLPYQPLDSAHPWLNDKQFPMGAPSTTPPIVRSYSLPAVSVVIPVGPNHARYLPAALDSLLAQTCREWEAIVVNDSGQALPLTPYPFVRVIDIGQGNGAGKARNEGIAAAHAPLLLFLDADDVLAPNAIEAMLKAFVAHDGQRYVYSDWISAEDGKLHRMSEYDPATELDRQQHAVTALVPTEWVRAVGGFDTELVGWEDWDFSIKLAIRGACGVRAPLPLLYYRTESGTRRKAALANREAIRADILGRYGAYTRGEKTMGCGCGNGGAAVLAAKRALGGSRGFNGTYNGGGTRAMAENTVRMRYTGENAGAITFQGYDRRMYRGGNNATNRYQDVHPDDVERLASTGRWEVVTPPAPTPTDDLTTLDGVGPELAETLEAAGLDTFKELAEVPEAELEAVSGIGEKRAKTIKAGAKRRAK